MNKTSSSASGSRKISVKKGALRDVAPKRQHDVENFTVSPIQVEEDSSEVASLEENDTQNQFDVLEENADQFQDPPLFQENAQDLPKEPKEFVKVSFSKFVQLVANHDFHEVIKKNENEEVILSSNLLADLASAHGEEDGKKIPIVFLVGLAIGVVLTYILITS